ncbi:MAG TPA: Tol-Pal system beta propeller repeat protein TolB [Candidatus Eisenbacteria bacterium]|nr:Tol-Pal system beta propeller repeat protein TolB [Candidatus Eisenbacteria bacterium]
MNARPKRGGRAIVALAALAWLAGAGAARAQSRDVRIDISGGGQKIRLHVQGLTAAPDDPHASAKDAQELLARDLDDAAVFTVSRGWNGEAPVDVQGIVIGRWSVSGGRITLDGEVTDASPARLSILRHEYRGGVGEWRDLIHQFSDDIVLQFTGEPGVARTRIAFVAQQGRNRELYVMNLDGSDLHPLTADRSIALSPSWSPDGSLLLFTSYRGGTPPRIWVMAATGGRPYLISGRRGNNTSASYSPDGRDIACTLSQDGNAEVYLLDARGGSPRRVTSNRAIDTSPSWSPTGRELAFTSDRGGTPQVYVMDREGGNLRRLTYDVSYTDSPAWSPKGDRIAFVARDGNGFDVWVCRADGSGGHAVAVGGLNENPKWSPDGRHLVFASTRDGAQGLYVTDLDGRPPRRLDTGGLRALSPAWSPRPPSAVASATGRSVSQPGGHP